MVRHLHASGRWDRSGSVLHAELLQWIAELLPDVITGTEAGDGDRGRAYVLPGFKRVQHGNAVGADECVLAYREAVFELVDWESVPVSNATYKRANGKDSPRFFALNVALRIIGTNEVLVFSVLHTPSAVDSPNGWRPGRRAVVYKLVAVGWRSSARKFTRRVRKQLGRRFRVHKVLCGDFNLHLLRPWARNFIASTFPSLTQLWTKVKPNGGTLGYRVIDTSLLSRFLQAVSARVLGQPRSSDHRPFVEDIAIRPRRKR